MDRGSQGRVNHPLGYLHQCLQKGANLHAFRSGGGLRVVCLRKGEEELGYGEHPHIEEALQHADEDAAVGKQPYSEVYGGLYDHYLTGSSTPSSDLDRWILAGRTFDVTYKGAQFIATMLSSEETVVPKDLIERVRTSGEKEIFENRGYTYLAAPCSFPDGSAGVSYEVLRTEKNKGKAWIWKAIRIGCGSSIMEALANGLLAEPIEVEHE